MRRVLEDHRSAPIEAKERALFDLVEKLNARAPEVGPADIAAAKAAGWTEEAIYDAITVCSLFNFYNMWCDGAGVRALPEAVFRERAQKMTDRGYRMEF